MNEEKFSQWIEDLTAGSNFSRRGSVPNKSQLASFLSVKSFPPVLEYMIKQVRPPQERQHIRNNLKNSYFTKHLVEEKNVTEIQRKHSRMKALVQDAEGELHAETEQLKKLVEEERRLQLEEQKLRTQMALLSIACREREEATKKLKKQKDAITHLLPELPKLLSPQDESIKQKAAIEDLDSILAKLKALRIEILDDKDGDFHDKKLEVWNLVNTLIGTYCPATVVKALSSVIAREADAVAQTANAVDHVADAKILNFKYSNGVFTDVLNPHGIVETVELMMAQMSAKHIKRHLELQKLKQETKLTRDYLEAISSTLFSVLNEVQKDPLLISAIMDLFRATVRTGGLKASLGAASSMIRDLETRAGVARRGRDSITEKFSRINSFEKTVKNRNDELKHLVVAISHNLKNIKEENESMTSIVEKNTDTLVLPTPFLIGSFSKECDAVMNVPFEALITIHTEHGRMPCCSIGPADDLYSDLSGLSHFVPYVAPWENVIETIRVKKTLQRHNETQLAEEKANLEEKKKAADEPLSIYAVKALQRRVQTHDQRQEKAILPVLRKCEEANSNGEKVVARFKELVEDWWSQPGSEVKQYLKEKSSI